MGSLVWVLNLWGMRLAAGAAVLATMGAAVAMYSLAQEAREQLVTVAEHQKGEQASMWKGL